MEHLKVRGRRPQQSLVKNVLGPACRVHRLEAQRCFQAVERVETGLCDVRCIRNEPIFGESLCLHQCLRTLPEGGLAGLPTPGPLHHATYPLSVPVRLPQALENACKVDTVAAANGPRILNVVQEFGLPGNHMLALQQGGPVVIGRTGAVVPDECDQIPRVAVVHAQVEIIDFPVLSADVDLAQIVQLRKKMGLGREETGNPRRSRRFQEGHPPGALRQREHVGGLHQIQDQNLQETVQQHRMQDKPLGLSSRPPLGIHLDVQHRIA